MASLDQYEQLRQSIIQKITVTPNAKPMRYRKNIFLIGTPGSGKSTLINSMIMTLNKEGYAEFAYHGDRGKGGMKERVHITPAFRCYDVFDCIQEFQQDTDKIRPLLFDFKGLTNSYDENMKAIMKAIMCGMIPENTLLEKLEKKKVKSIKKMYQFEDPKSWKDDLWADVCIYVMAATEETPANLLCAVHEATGHELFEVPKILVITKKDLIKDDEAQQKQFQKRKDSAMECLGLCGTNERVFEVTNYCSNTQFTRCPEMDQKFGEVWKTILARQYLRRENKVPEESRWCEVQ